MFHILLNVVFEEFIPGGDDKNSKKFGFWDFSRKFHGRVVAAICFLSLFSL